jgi:type I restriction-modification system DNA methylase subunit
MTYTKEQAKEEISGLIKRLEEVMKDGKERDYSEADVGSKFILPLIEKLGWSIENIDEVKEQQRTLVGPADYSLNIDKKHKILIEIKKFERLDGYRIKGGKKQTFPEQATEYAWSIKADWALLTNFKETRLYYSHVKKPEEGLIFKLSFNKYLEQFDKLWILSKESVVSGVLDTYEKKRTREEIDVEILKDLYESRILLTKNIHLKNPELDKGLLRESVQKILDRLIVIRFAEDRNIIPSDSIFKQLKTWKETVLNKEVRTFMMDLKNSFRDFDSIYNTRLFEEHPCEDLKMDNEVIEEVINRLYKYNFDMISSDVLGAVYENYIGHILMESGEGVEIAEDKKVKKSLGIYYTPTYVVDYIVKSTLGELLKDKTPEEISKIKVLDPACGSGSFLIKAFDYIKEYYNEYNKKAYEGVRKNKTIEGFADLITNIEKKILTENLFGVDIDEQAAEITSVNLMLKALKKGEKLPQILYENIKVGNSLISGSEEELKKYFGDEWKDKKAFNWEEELDGKFDIVMGNPPYGAELNAQERNYISKNYITSGSYKNSAMAFIERGYNLLNKTGSLGLIVPKSLTYSDGWSKAVELILPSLKYLVDASKAFKGVLLEQVVIILDSGKTNDDFYESAFFEESKVSEYVLVPKTTYETCKTLITSIRPNEFKIYKKMSSQNNYFKDVSTSFRGLPWQKYLNSSGNTKILRGEHIERFWIKESFDFIDLDKIEGSKSKIELLRRPKIISQNIVAHVTKPTPHIIIMSTLDKNGILNLDTVTNTVITNNEYSLEYLLCILNCRLTSWYTHRFIYNNAIRTMHFDDYYIGKIPIPAGVEQAPFIDLANKMTSLVQQKRDLLNAFWNLCENRKTYEKDLFWLLKNSTIVDATKSKNINPNSWNNIKHDRFEIKVTNNKLIIKGSNTILMEIVFNDSDLALYTYFVLRHYEEDGRLIDKTLKNLCKYITIPVITNPDKELKEQIIDELKKKFRNINLPAIDKEILEINEKIDQLAYTLYGLTEEEIKIVEEST